MADGVKALLVEMRTLQVSPAAPTKGVFAVGLAASALLFSQTPAEVLPMGAL